MKKNRILLVLLIFQTFVLLMLCEQLIVVTRPKSTALDDNYNYGYNWITNSECIDRVAYDTFKDFDNYTVIKKQYKGADIVNGYIDTIPKEVNKTYYYILNKTKNDLEGAYNYEQFNKRCNELGLRLF